MAKSDNILWFSIDFLLKMWYHLGAYTLLKKGAKICPEITLNLPKNERKLSENPKKRK